MANALKIRMKTAEDAKFDRFFKACAGELPLAELKRLGAKRGALTALTAAHWSTGATGLHLAARSGSVDAVNALLGLLKAAGLDVDAKDKYGQSSLHVACERSEGFEPVARALIQGGVNIDARDGHGASALSRLLRSVKLDEASLLIELGAREWAAPGRGAGGKGAQATPLGLLAQCESEEVAARCVSLALLGGADIDERDEHGRTALMTATQACVEEGMLPNLLHLLIDNGASLDLLDGQRCSALDLACEVDNLWAARILIKAGASMHALGALQPALAWAVASGSLRCARALEAAGADTEFWREDGGLSVQAGAGFVCCALSSAEGQAELIKALIGWGASPDAKDVDGNLPLVIAGSLGNADAVRAMLEAGANVDMVDYEGDSALGMAIRTPRGREVARLLFAAGCSLGIEMAGDEFGREWVGAERARREAEAIKSAVGMASPGSKRPRAL